MTLEEIVSDFQNGDLNLLSKADLHNARNIVQQRVTDIDNEQLDYGETDELVEERELLDAVEAQILYLLE